MRDELIHSDIFHRTEMAIGPGALAVLRASSAIIFGVGGVGSWCAEALARTGVGRLVIVDSDLVCATNINRQLQATSLNVGAVKVDELAARLRVVNPAVEILAIHRSFDAGSWEDFRLGEYDYIIDAIDSVANKVLLIEKTLGSARAPTDAGDPALARGLGAAARPTLFSSMGAAAKLDPTRVRVAPLGETKVCPLARIVRRMLRERGIPADFLCVYSDEPPVPPRAASVCGTAACSCFRDRADYNESAGPGAQAQDWCGRKKRINGSLAHMTGIFGLTLAGLVVQDVCRRAGESAAD